MTAEKTASSKSLSDAFKKQLKSTVVELRRLLEEDIGRELRRLGIDPSKSALVPIEDLKYLTDVDREARQALDAALAKEMETAGEYRSAVEALRREAAYTHLNRLVGLKCLELRGYLVIEGERTEAVTCRPEFGGRPKWLWSLRDRESKYRHGEEAEELLWREGLERAYVSVSEEIGILFDPNDVYAQVWPSHRALRDTVNALNGLPEDAFRADELLGWVYQYFQSEEKDRVFEELRTKKKKIDWQDIVAVTQIYTERYMVDFLLQNSIGARWMQMYPNLDAKTRWPYYVAPATPHTRAPKPLKEWRILDPCLGSGHFLVVAFDLLVQLYAEEREMVASGRLPAHWAVPEDEVARTILERNLFGIDIDPRAVQIAVLALYLKAKDYGLDTQNGPPRMNLVAADAVLPRGPHYEALLALYRDDPAAQDAIEAVWSALEHVRELGSLVRVEEEVERAVRRARSKEDREAPLLSSAKDWAGYKGTLLNRLSRAFEAESQNEDVVARIFGLEARKGVGLLDLLSRRYDVVCTNPPYMGSGNMGKILKSFVAKHYKAGKRDLYAAFILRCLELSREGGHVAMVTQQSWMFLRSFTSLRAMPEEKLAKAEPGEFRGVLREASIETLAHLGPNAFAEISGEVVNIALFTFRKEPPGPEHRIMALRLVGPKSPVAKERLLSDAVLSENRQVVLRPIQQRFLLIPQSPLCYWLRERFFELLAGRTLGDEAKVLQGLATGNDPRFVRYIWEVPLDEWARPVRERRWVPFEKGGGYGKWFGHHWWVVDWQDNGAEVRAYPGSRVQNEQHYFREGWTYSVTARGCLGFRSMRDSIFSTQSAGVVLQDAAQVAAILNARSASSLIRALTAQMYLRESYVSRIPLPRHVPEWLHSLEATSIFLKRWLVCHDPTERSFNPGTLTPNYAEGEK